ncbi:hypothetical protein SV7mr_34900 [Stieleria bergensis]|uniref:Uncharacterized protein n=1 Tax=Stieleria bergensis TaxID=2528025 RepID=A0A517SY55_9BACT|nr:hypothetical protein SV7mr_34900 [Planctomycetes bacterium SV_7m_r]
MLSPTRPYHPASIANGFQRTTQPTESLGTQRFFTRYRLTMHLLRNRFCNSVCYQTACKSNARTSEDIVIRKIPPSDEAFYCKEFCHDDNPQLTQETR